MISIDTVLIKVASRCNINCSYCYVYNMGDSGWARMPKRISQQTLSATARELSRLLEAQCRGFAVVLHGGEPLLLGPDRLESTLHTLKHALSPECTLNLQTNGTLIDNSILDVCVRHGCTVSVSIDGPAPVHDRFRLDHQGRPTHSRVLRGIDKLKRHPMSGSLFSGVLAVIDPASEPEQVYEHLKSLGAPSIDLLYRDGNHSKLPPGKKSFKTTEHGQWLCRLFDLYIIDPAPPRIRLLDDMVKLLLGGTGEKEGVGITDYGILVIDTDGTITKNDTLKSSFDGADKFSAHWSVHRQDLVELVSSAEFLEFHCMQQPTSDPCQKCPELGICGGGMPLHRWNNSDGFRNPSIYCEDQKLIISHIRTRIQEFVDIP